MVARQPLHCVLDARSITKDCRDWWTVAGDFAIADGFRTAAWSTEDVIVFGGSPMSRVSAAGGDLVSLTVPGVPANVGGQGFPSFLPDGRHYFYLARQGGQNVAYVAALDSSAPVPLPGVTSEVKYSAGHILFLRDGVLMAQRFDVDRLQLSGEAFTIADLVAPRNAVAGPFSVSDGGTLAYRRSEFQGESRLVWLDRSGREVGVAAGVGDYDDLELSPDENFVAFESTTGLGGSSSDAGDIFVLDLVRGVTSRVTSDPQRDADPLWSPDGKTIVFRGDRDGGHLYARAFGVVGEDRLLLKGQSREEPDHWSPDGRYITYQSRGDIWALPMAGEQRPIQITNSPASDREGRVSPDGHWIAYQSNEPGVTEVFIQSFPDARAKRQVSTGGGSEPRWSHDGRELYYVSGDFTLMAVTVKASGDSLAIGVPEKLFPASAARGEGNYAVSKTGRFLMRSPMLSRTTPNITVILNWAAGLPR